MKLTIKYAVVCAAILGGTATSAFSAEFNFAVPVRVSALPPEVTNIGVNCKVAKTRLPDGRLWDVIASSGPLITPQELSGDTHVFNVRFDADLGKNATEARYYECVLRVFVLIRGERFIFVGQPDQSMGLITNNILRPTMPAAQATSPVVHVTDSLP